MENHSVRIGKKLYCVIICWERERFMRRDTINRKTDNTGIQVTVREGKKGNAADLEIKRPGF